MKKRLFLTSMLIICFISIGSGTLAYFTASSKAHNIITTGSVDIAVEEWRRTEQGLEPYPNESVSVMPGKKVSKIVRIRNKSAESYIRACVEVIFIDSAGRKKIMTAEEWNNLLHLDINSRAWQQKENDSKWWYYVLPVSENDVTEPLFYEVVFDGKNMDDSYQNSSIEVCVAAQAVQTANNAESAMTALGWPGE